MASGWTLAGVRQSGRHPAELPLARAAVARWERLAEELKRRFGLPQWRFTNSGTESTMDAVHLARGSTGRTS